MLAKKGVLTLISFLALNISIFAGSQSPYTLQPLSAGFRVTLPAKPIFRSSEATESGHAYKVSRYTLVQGNLMYQVVWTDMDNQVPADREDYFLRSAIDGLAKSARASVASNVLINYEGHPARSFVLTDAKHWAWNGLVCWDGRRGILVTVRAPNAEAANVASGQLLASFHLLSN